MAYVKIHPTVAEEISVEHSVSIAMATYNGSSFIRDQLTSIINQTRLPNEIIICDDCSIDNTIEIVEEVLRSSSIKKKVIKNESRVGWRQNFINVMGLCNSDLIAFCDQDDVWESDKLEVLVGSFISTDIQMVYHNAALIDKNGNVIGSLNEKAGGVKISSPSNSMDFWTPIFGFSIVFRRDLIKYSSYWIYSIDKLNREEKAAHDEWIFFLSSILGEIVYVDSNLVRYRIHGNNSVGLRVSSKSLKDYYTIYKSSFKKINDRNFLIENRLDIIHRIILKNPKIEKLQTASVAYKNHLEFNKKRIKMYSQKGVFRRMSTLAIFYKNNYYKSESLPLSSGERVRDFVVALFGV